MSAPHSPSPTRKSQPSHLWRNISNSSALTHTDLAETSVANDLQYDLDQQTGPEDLSEDGSDSDLESLRQVTSNTYVSMVGSYRQASAAAAGSRAALGSEILTTTSIPSRRERIRARKDEQNLLQDNKILKPAPSGESLGRRLSRTLFSSGPDNVLPTNGDFAQGSAETAPLLGNQQDARDVDQKWEDAVLHGQIQTTWRRETQVLARSSAPLIVTFLLQYSLTVASIFTVGHLGKVELGAVSLASMTANITGYSAYYGLATSLDTLCSQAYGSGKRKLVGLQLQRMVLFLWAVTIPIGILWLCADLILVRIVPEKDVAILAGQYLKIVLIGAPGFACFESVKRYLQAQGLYSASLYVLLICAPLNVLFNWLFVWVLDLGFVGAPIAVALTDNLLFICIVVYVRYVAGSECWPGLTKRALSNWGPMVRLAIPGYIMVEAEVAAFEILTLASSYFDTSTLAAQSVLYTLSSMTFNIPFPISIASSNRIANLIGATLEDAAKVTARVVFIVAVVVGLINIVLLAGLKDVIPSLFTNDDEVAAIVSDTIPIVAAFQLFDSLACTFNGILRGLGRQEIGGYVQLGAYYIIAIPISLGLAFGLRWELHGLWTGVAIGLFLVTLIEGFVIYKIDWQRSVQDARARNERG